MPQQTPSTEHLCDGCRHYGVDICVTDSGKFPYCWEGEKIMTPLERHLSEFKLEDDKDEGV